MTVRELILKLQECDDQAKVYIKTSFFIQRKLPVEIFVKPKRVNTENDSEVWIEQNLNIYDV